MGSSLLVQALILQIIYSIIFSILSFLILLRFKCNIDRPEKISLAILSLLMICDFAKLILARNYPGDEDVTMFVRLTSMMDPCLSAAITSFYLFKIKKLMLLICCETK